jgi:hypothetical protein
MDANYDFDGASEFVRRWFQLIIVTLNDGLAKVLNVFIEGRYKVDTNQLTNFDKVNDLAVRFELLAERI